VEGLGSSTNQSFLVLRPQPGALGAFGLAAWPPRAAKQEGCASPRPSTAYVP